MDDLIVREMNLFQRVISRLENFIIRFRRKYIPYLVYYGQELDVRILFKNNKLKDIGGVEGAWVQFNRGELREIEQRLQKIGIKFDTGLGIDGRDWEWDWSLAGPISVKFCRVCKTKGKRE